MKIAQLHPNEKKRIESLQALELLDTLPEADFDSLTKIASQICDTPIALISLVDKDRQWFKSKVGLEASETHRDFAFCSHAILQDDVFVVEDSSKDNRFFDNPLATGAPFVQFYAGAPLLAPDGLPIGTVCVIDSKARQLSKEQIFSLKSLSQQITRLLELKTQINKLKNSEHNLLIKKTAADNIAEGILLQNSDLEIIDFNSAALNVLQMSAEDFIEVSQARAWKAVKEDGSNLCYGEHPASMCLKTGEPQKNTIIGLRLKNELRWLNVNSVPLFFNPNSSAASHVVTSFADITDLRNSEIKRLSLESQLSESSRLSALGEMAGGIAHEINNPLSIIRGKAAVLKRKYQDGVLDDATATKEFQVIENTVDRIAKIIKGLKTYSRNADNDPFDTVSLSGILDDTLELCRERFKNELVKIDIEKDSKLHVKCRSAQISQIIMNLLINSLDAIQKNSEKWIKIQIFQNADLVCFKITDSGNGIDPAIVKKIMQPFFTTKEVGKGTGLGLSISKGIAESHGGKLEYDETSKNTSFILTLPKAEFNFGFKVA